MKTWEKTREQNLVRHKSGRYYARTFGNGKEIWKSLRTAHFSVAKARLAEFLRDHREKQAAPLDHTTDQQATKLRIEWGLQMANSDSTSADGFWFGKTESGSQQREI